MKYGTLHRRVAQVLLTLAVFSAVPNLSTHSFAAESTTQQVAAADPSFNDDQLLPQNIHKTIEQTLKSTGDLSPLHDLLVKKSANQPALVESLLAVALEEGELSLAEKNIQQILQVSPARKDLQSILASIQSWRGDDQASRATLKQASADAMQKSSVDIHIKQAVLLFDMKDIPAGQRELALAVAAGSSAEESALIASFFGQDQIAAQILESDKNPDQKSAASLWRGAIYLRAGKATAAEREFRLALAQATSPRERQFIYERLASSVRASGRLTQLADEWLADSRGQTDRLLPLISVLRELGRVDDIFQWLSHAADRSDDQSQLLHNPALQREIIAAAVEKGRINDARHIYQDLLKQAPDNTDVRLGLARLEIDDDHADVADQLLLNWPVQGPGTPLLRAAHIARSLGRNNVAMELASRALSHNRETQVAALLLQAQILLSQGQSDRSAELLSRAADLANGEAQLIGAIADAYEQSGNRSRAIAMFRSVAEKKEAESLLPRLAWLLEQENDTDGARDLWYRIWRTTTVAPRQVEARDHYLDLASKSGTIADLALSIEDNLSAGKADRAELLLLVEIYTRMRDATSAAEIIQTYRDRLGGEIAMLELLARIYVQCERFSQADSALRRLLQINPQNRADYLQQIAVIAVERKRPDVALRAMQELDGISGENRSAASIRAGIYDQLGQAAKAQIEYRRNLATHQDQAEDWLLWAQAAANNDQRDQALGRLLVLSENAPSDDSFIVAMDGLMNLHAQPHVLKAARRSALLRLAQKPDKLGLYNVVNDLSDAVSDSQGAFRIQELALLVGGEQRTSILRDLITAARNAGDTASATAYGNTLVALGEQVPPQVFMDLGQQLLAEKRVFEAGRAFARAREVSGNDTSVLQNIAELLRKSGFIDQALHQLHDLARLNPTDLELQLKIAELAELNSRYADSLKDYTTILSTLIDKQSRQRVSSAQTVGSTTAQDRRQRAAAGTSITEFQRLFDPSFDGALASARDTKLRQQLIAIAEEWVRREMTSLPDVRNIADAPRLETAAMVLRRASFAFDSIESADRVDRQLLERFPADSALASTLMQDRISWGYTDSAARLFPSDRLPKTFLSRQALAEGKDLSVDQENVAQLPQLIFLNRNKDASALLRRQLDAKSPLSAATLQTLSAAALALDDSASARELLARVMRPTDSATALDGSTLIAVTSSAWPYLSDQEKIELSADLRRLAARATGNDRNELARVALSIDCALGNNASEAALQAALENPSPAIATLVLHYAQGDQQVQAVRRIINAVASAKRRGFIFSWLGNLDIALSQASRDVLIEVFAASPNARGAGDERYAQISQSRWNRSITNADFSIQLARILLKESPKDVGLMATLAVALNNQQSSAESLGLCRQIIESIAGKKQIARSDTILITDIIRSMPPQARLELVGEPGSAKSLGGDSSQLIRGLILQSLDSPETTSIFREAFLQNPAAVEPRRILLDHLEGEFRSAELVELLLPFAQDENVVKPPERIRLLRHLTLLRRYNDALRVISMNSSPIEGLQRVQLECARGNMNRALSQLRAMLVDNRRERRFYTPYLFASYQNGGLLDHDTAMESPFRRVNVYQVVAQSESGRNEIHAILGTVTPGGNDLPGLIDGLVSAATTPEIRNAQITSLLADRHSLNFVQRATLLRLLQDEPAKLPESSLNLLTQILLDTPADDGASLGAIARTLEASGRKEQALRIDRWNLASSFQTVKRARAVAAASQTSPVLPDSLLKISAVRPWDEMSDQVAAKSLDLQLKNPADAENEFKRLQQLGKISFLSHPRTWLVGAKIAAAQNDAAAYRSRIELALRCLVRRNDRIALDLSTTLPQSGSLGSWAQTGGDVLLRLKDSGVLSPSDYLHELCALAAGCHRRGDTATAEKFLIQAQAANSHPSESDLWIADLARTLDRRQIAVDRETALLRQRALPIARVEKLLEDVKTLQSEQAADALAALIASDTDEPAILQAAIRHGRRQGGDIANLEKRLSAE